jgi:hypothetical protein
LGGIFQEKGGRFYPSLTIFRAGAHTDLTVRVLILGRTCNQTAASPMNMIATQLPQCSRPASRPAFRVLCAWCEQPIEQATARERLTGNSHGICVPCARRYFGVELEFRAANEGAAE